MSVVCRRMALCNLLVSPFLMVFLLIYFFLRNAEKFYHHPSSIGARRWSGLAFWRMREFNELPHYIRHRSAAHCIVLNCVKRYTTHFLRCCDMLHAVMLCCHFGM